MGVIACEILQTKEVPAKLNYPSIFHSDPLLLQKFNFGTYARCKAPYPAIRVYDPMAGNMGSVGVTSHRVSNSTICFCAQGFGNSLIACYSTRRNFFN